MFESLTKSKQEEILRGYKSHEDHIWLNVFNPYTLEPDPDLRPIKVNILDLIDRTYKRYNLDPPGRFPDMKYIDGFGLPAKDQVFTRTEVPHKITLLIELAKKRARKEKKDVHTWLSVHIATLSIFWETLEAKSEYYSEEIRWLERLWYHRLFGYWFFNNGIPTYMTGANFMYLNFYTIPTKNIKPQYRDRDRRWFISRMFAITDTTTFKEIDHNGYAVANKDGDYDMIDIGVRTCYGTTHSKPRRVGDTSKATAEEIERATRTVKKQFSNQGIDDTTSARIFKVYISKPFEDWPIFLKPLQKRLNPQEEYKFESNDFDLGLGSWIDYADSKKASKYDGSTIEFYYGDEIGKLEYSSIGDRHSTIKLAMSERDLIQGDIVYTTTVEKMDLEGGRQFLKFCKESNYYQRKDNGQTLTGMYVVHFSAADGHPSFLDKYGMSIIDNPTPEQAKFINKKYGAKKHILNDWKLLKGEELSKRKRQDPLYFKHVFTPPPKSNFFNMRIVETRLEDIQMSDKPYRIGNFVWEEKRFGRVKWVDDENGRFKLSISPDDINSSAWVTKNGVKYPTNPDKYIMCIDPFRVNKTDSWRVSKGSIAVLWKRDYSIDGDDVDVADWKSHRFVCTYLARPETTDEFAEDALRCGVFFGAMAYPENNISLIQDKFIEWGYHGFLLYDTDSETGLKKNNAGFNTNRFTTMELFNAVRDYIDLHGMRERHDDFLYDVSQIPSPDRMTDFDTFVACAGALKGNKSKYQEFLTGMSTEYDTSQWMPTYDI